MKKSAGTSKNKSQDIIEIFFNKFLMNSLQFYTAQQHRLYLWHYWY